VTVVKLVYGKRAENFDGKAACRSGVNQRQVKAAQLEPALGGLAEGRVGTGCARVPGHAGGG